MAFQSEDLRRYYDANTDRFVQHGQGGAAIRRAVWGPGVTDRRAAMHFVDELVLAEVRALPAAHVLDLGCGVGASLQYLATRSAVRGTGVTISGVQASRAAALLERAGLAGRVRCVQGDFLALGSVAADVDLAFSIEAFVLSPDAAGYFREAQRVLRPGGRLVICDDFLGEARAPSPDEARWLEDFRRGWRVSSLLSPARTVELAAAHGFTLVRQHDLSQYLELGRPRDRLIRALVSIGGWLPLEGEYWAALKGGDALQRALGTGALTYRVLVFER